VLRCKYGTDPAGKLAMAPTLRDIAHVLPTTIAGFERLAVCVSLLPSRYGTDPAGKLAIGSKIATELLAKLLDDLRASKEESLATLTGKHCSNICCLCYG
jgi:hypothetical protein